ncbi:hypothetical protein D3C78_1671530 [compost metagenome]
MKDLSLPHNVTFEQLVGFYLECTEWFCKTKSISNMLANLNALVLLIVNGKPTENGPKMIFPDGWSSAFMMELKTPEHVTAYKQHLYKLGYRPHRKGSVETWVKE